METVTGTITELMRIMTVIMLIILVNKNSDLGWAIKIAGEFSDLKIWAEASKALGVAISLDLASMQMCIYKYTHVHIYICIHIHVYTYVHDISL